MKSYQCWKCGAALNNLILPLSRREECGQCGADQHVCRLCEFFSARSGCSEDRAEHVSDPEKANFCDYLKPSTEAYHGSPESRADEAKARLAALFGDPPPDSKNTDAHLTPQQLAEKKLRELLGG